MAPEQIEKPTGEAAPDDFVSQFANHLGLGREATQAALGELLVHYHAVAQRRLLATKPVEREEQTSTEPDEAWVLA